MISLHAPVRLAVAALLIISAGSAAAAPAKPLAPGRYCLKMRLHGFTGIKGHDIDLGNLLMTVNVKKRRGHYAVGFWNDFPDSEQDLVGSSERVRVLSDGSLAFNFFDNWGNFSRGRLRPDGRISLVPIKTKPYDSGTRNYDTYRVSRTACSAGEFHDD